MNKISVEILREFEAENALLAERVRDLTRDMQEMARCHQIELTKLRKALEQIAAHGCCTMHSDSGCPGCIAVEVLK